MRKALITERKRVEETLRWQAQLLRLSYDAIIVWQIDGGIESWNRGAEELYGFTESEARGRIPRELLKTIWPVPWPEIDTVIRSHGQWEGELRHCAKEGREVIVSAHFQVVRGADGTERVLETNRDITEHKRADEKIRQQNKILEAINRIFEKALTCDTEEDLGRMCLSVVEELTDSKFSFVGEIGKDGWLHDIAISDLGWGLCAMYDKTGHRRPPGDFKIHGLYGRVLQDGKSLLTNAPASHPDSIGVPEGHPQLTAFLGVPFIHRYGGCGEPRWRIYAGAAAGLGGIGSCNFSNSLAQAGGGSVARERGAVPDPG